MRFLYIGLGFICIGLGVIGAFLPVMPTTPFLLLALFFFGKSSQRLHQWFLQTEIYKKHLKSFDEQRALTKKSKISILTLSTVMMAISFYFTPIYGRICIVILLLIEYWFFFFWIKTINEGYK
ncbi:MULTISPECIES: YbaN family protein [unclassified Lonepinella]|uniref:YbaN family protein n=2 Tax=unclassified Lonepinella TaxID=2642006 RepID=UPI0036D983DC